MLAFLFGINNKEMPHAIAWGISLLVETRPRQTQFASARKTEGISGGHHIRKYLELVSMERLCDTTCETPSPDFSSKL